MHLPALHAGDQLGLGGQAHRAKQSRPGRQIMVRDVGDDQDPLLVHFSVVKRLVSQQGLGEGHFAAGKMGNGIDPAGFKRSGIGDKVPLIQFFGNHPDPACVEPARHALVQPLARVILPDPSHQANTGFPHLQTRGSI